MSRPWLFALAATLWQPATLPAQGSGRAVSGTVVDSINGRPLSGAVLYLDGSRDEHRSGSNGRFLLEGVPAGSRTLVVRRIGYVPARVSVPDSPSASSVDVGTVPLRPVATELDRIAVEAEEVRLFPHMSDFYRRKQDKLPGGTFITRDEIQRSGVRRTSEMLTRSPRMQMDCPNVRLGDDQCTARNRRARNNPFVNRDPEGADKCAMEVFIDGQRTSQKVDEIPLTWIAGIEMYPGPSTTPPAFGNGRCGVIAIWTTQARG